MFNSFRARSPGKPLAAILFYEAWWMFFWVLLVVFYRLRIWGRERVPAAVVNGKPQPFIIALNHQSHFDPILAGKTMPKRHLGFIARATLFTNPVFGWAISALGAFPINQKAADTQAIRETIAQLERGRAVMIFPEGSRTPTGAIHPFKRGIWLLISRSKCPVLPVAIEGAYDAWPRKRSFPKLFGQRLMMNVGEPIPSEKLLAMGSQAGLAFLASAIETLRLELVDKLAAAGHAVTTKPMCNIDLDEEGFVPAEVKPSAVRAATGV